MPDPTMGATTVPSTADPDELEAFRLRARDFLAR